MKQKLTIAEKLAKRNYKTPSNLAWFGYKLLSNLPFFAPKYRVTYKIIDDIREEKGPCFIVWNHLSRRDYLFIKKIIAPKKFNMVAGYSEFFRRKFYGLFKYSQILPKKNFTNDPIGVRAINKIIKSGGCVSFSPEGMSSIYGHNQPVVPGTGRFLQFYKVPVYFVKLEGAYLTSHKTDIKDRIGKVTATISKLFTPEDLTSMTTTEIEDKLNLTFKHDDYEWNKTARVKYKIRNRAAYNLETICYKCPKCGKDLVMVGEGNKLYCKECGNGCTINDYYDFIPFNKECIIPESLTKWVEFERKDLIQEIRKDKDYSFEFKCEIGDLPEYKLMTKNKSSIKCGNGKFKIDHNGIHFVGTRHDKEYKFDLSYEAYYTILIEEATDIFSLFVNGEYIVFYPEDVRCVGKSLLLVEEMHRYHVNTWKNFPWNNHLYKGTELEKK